MFLLADISPQASHKRILVAGGGTGGHVYPAIAVADALKELDSTIEILFVGTRQKMEWTAVPKAGYQITSIWISGFHRRFTLKNLVFPIKLIISLIQSFRILKVFRPDAVLVCGGYVSGPVGWMAARLGIPLFIQEQNSYPGVTNRLLSKHATTIFTAFKEAEKTLPSDHTKNLGNPVRATLRMDDRTAALDTFKFNDTHPVILILGGSGGALSINKAVQKNLQLLHDELNLQIIWQCGHKYYDTFSTELDLEKWPNLRLKAYINTMPEAYCAADLVISRAGALSCSELQLTGSASILIPSPHVAADHQTLNAQSMVREGAAVLLPDHDAAEKLGETVRGLINDRDQLQAMAEKAQAMGRADADKQIAEQILSHINDTTANE